MSLRSRLEEEVVPHLLGHSELCHSVVGQAYQGECWPGGNHGTWTVISTMHQNMMDLFIHLIVVICPCYLCDKIFNDKSAGPCGGGGPFLENCIVAPPPSLNFRG